MDKRSRDALRDKRFKTKVAVLKKRGRWTKDMSDRALAKGLKEA